MVFKQIKTGLAKFFTPNRIFIIVIFLILAYALLVYSNSKKWNGMDMMTNASSSIGDSSAISSVNPNAAIYPSGELVNNPLYAPQSVVNPSELLPHDENSSWGSLNPALSNKGIMTPDLLNAGSLIGLDTIGQTMKNPNLQLRSDPVIEKKVVSPFLQSTIEPDYIRSPFEINSGVR
jgi:hypothetical protein